MRVQLNLIAHICRWKVRFTFQL